MLAFVLRNLLSSGGIGAKTVFFFSFVCSAALCYIVAPLKFKVCVENLIKRSMFYYSQGNIFETERSRTNEVKIQSLVIFERFNAETAESWFLTQYGWCYSFFTKP